MIPILLEQIQHIREFPKDTNPPMTPFLLRHLQYISAVDIYHVKYPQGLTSINLRFHLDSMTEMPTIKLKSGHM